MLKSKHSWILFLAAFLCRNVLAATSEQSDCLFMSIGNQNYERWPALRSPRLDAYAVMFAFSTECDIYSNSMNSTDASTKPFINLTATEMVQALDNFVLHAKENGYGRTVLFFAGHGQVHPIYNRQYLIPIDHQNELKYNQGIDLENLKMLFRYRFPNGEHYIISDACMTPPKITEANLQENESPEEDVNEIYAALVQNDDGYGLNKQPIKFSQSQIGKYLNDKENIETKEYKPLTTLSVDGKLTLIMSTSWLKSAQEYEAYSPMSEAIRLVPLPLDNLVTNIGLLQEVLDHNTIGKGIQRQQITLVTDNITTIARMNDKLDWNKVSIDTILKENADNIVKAMQDIKHKAHKTNQELDEQRRFVSELIFKQTIVDEANEQLRQLRDLKQQANTHAYNKEVIQANIETYEGIKNQYPLIPGVMSLNLLKVRGLYKKHATLTRQLALLDQERDKRLKDKAWVQYRGIKIGKSTGWSKHLRSHTEATLFFETNLPPTSELRVFLTKGYKVLTSKCNVKTGGKCTAILPQSELSELGKYTLQVLNASDGREMINNRFIDVRKI